MTKQLQSALALAVALALGATAGAQPCVGKRCAKVDNNDGTSQGCLGVTCGTSCQGCECSSGCNGAGCAFACKGLRCGEGCGGADCAFGSLGHKSATGCNGAKCGFGCRGNGCASDCLGASCGHTCVGDRCGDGCVGATCAHTCTGFQCARNCLGSYCNTNCQGDQCGCNDAPGSLSRCWYPDPDTNDAGAVYAKWIPGSATNGGVGRYEPSDQDIDHVVDSNGAREPYPATWPTAGTLAAAETDDLAVATPTAPGYVRLELVAARPDFSLADINAYVAGSAGAYNTLLDCSSDPT